MTSISDASQGHLLTHSGHLNLYLKPLPPLYVCSGVLNIPEINFVNSTLRGGGVPHNVVTWDTVASEMPSMKHFVTI